MLLPRALPDSFVAWNREWGAPFGHSRLRHLVVRTALDRLRLGRTAFALRMGGLFAIQSNNDTRTVEYPWAWFNAPSALVGLDVVEIGGALSGFQFALSRAGANVTNIDPAAGDPGPWGSSQLLPFDDATFARLNRVFGTDVTLRSTTIDEAGIPDASVDLVFSISTIEHIEPPEDLKTLMAEVHRVLRPGGRCILTIDLFLELAPFTDKHTLPYCRNVEVRELVEVSGLTMIAGDPAQLVGFDEFDTNEILRNLAAYFVGAGYPCCAQAVVLEKPA